MYIRRRVDGEYHPEYVLPTIKGGRGNIIIWGCMTTRGVGNVLVCKGRMNSATYLDMLEGILEPFIVKKMEKKNREGMLFQQDNHMSYGTSFYRVFARKWGKSFGLASTESRLKPH